MAARNDRPGHDVRPAAFQADHGAAEQSGATAPANTAAGNRREVGQRDTRRPGQRSLSADGEKARSSGPVVTTLASLAVVVGLFLLVMWFVRRHLPRGMGPLPSDVLEVLGRSSIGHKQPAALVRLGDRLLLVAAGGSGLTTLAEITDADQVTRLVALCHQSRPHSASAAFRQVLEQMSQPPRAGKAEDRHA